MLCCLSRYTNDKCTLNSLKIQVREKNVAPILTVRNMVLNENNAELSPFSSNIKIDLKLIPKIKYSWRLEANLFLTSPTWIFTSLWPWHCTKYKLLTKNIIMWIYLPVGSFVYSFRICLGKLALTVHRCDRSTELAHWMQCVRKVV